MSEFVDNSKIYLDKEEGSNLLNMIPMSIQNLHVIIKIRDKITKINWDRDGRPVIDYLLYTSCLIRLY